MVTCRKLDWRLRIAKFLAIRSGIPFAAIAPSVAHGIAWLYAGTAGIGNSFWDSSASRTLAQITPDATLGAKPSVVTPNVQVGNSIGDRIDGSTVFWNSMLIRDNGFTLPILRGLRTFSAG